MQKVKKCNTRNLFPTVTREKTCLVNKFIPDVEKTSSKLLTLKNNRDIIGNYGLFNKNCVKIE